MFESRHVGALVSGEAPSRVPCIVDIVVLSTTLLNCPANNASVVAPPSHVSIIGLFVTESSNDPVAFAETPCTKMKYVRPT
jgi:hypothetical protein